MRVNGWKGVARLFGMLRAVAIYVSAIEHDLNHLASDIASTEPNHGAYPGRHFPDVKQFARRERIEIPNQGVKAFPMLFDAFKQRANLLGSPPLAPPGNHGSKMQ